jgi:carbonic anhydrase
MADEMSNAPQDALDRLLEGNERFVSGRSSHDERIDEKRRLEVAGQQHPFAAVVACADSRVAPEHIFDAGLGELFVCRNAGNLADDDVVGSLEYAATHCDCPLLCVVGHSGCGAATAAVEVEGYPGLSATPCIASIVQGLSQAVSDVQGGGEQGAALVDAAARANVCRQVDEILHRSEVITEAVEAGRLGLAGLWYDLISGRVTTIVSLLVGPEDVM